MTNRREAIDQKSGLDLMRTDLGVQASEVPAVNRNVMLYWDDADPFPADIIAVSEKWRKFCPAWNVTLFGKETAFCFLRDKFGGDVARLFLACAFPAMRSDFFRVFWAISEGGIYSDVSFVPAREPLFFDAAKDLVVPRRSNGGIVINGFFFSKKDCKELKLIAYEIMKAVSKKEIPCILHATGPGAWMRALSPHETSTMAILEWEKLLGDFIKFSRYRSSVHSTPSHWKWLQLSTKIYRDHDDASDEAP